MTTITEAQNDLVTKRDLKDAFRDFKKTVMAPIKTDIAVLKWMTCLGIAGILLLVLKAFF